MIAAAIAVSASVLLPLLVALFSDASDINGTTPVALECIRVDNARQPAAIAAALSSVSVCTGSVTSISGTCSSTVIAKAEVLCAVTTVPFLLCSLSFSGVDVVDSSSSLPSAVVTSSGVTELFKTEVLSGES